MSSVSKVYSLGRQDGSKGESVKVNYKLRAILNSFPRLRRVTGNICVVLAHSRACIRSHLLCRDGSYLQFPKEQIAWASEAETIQNQRNLLGSSTRIADSAEFLDVSDRLTVYPRTRIIEWPG
jgi:hypothetical protein